ncbi:chromate transporter [Flavobacterium sp. FlaQc-30]|uniref:chromate transporter n=1 Tax=Flavobacterium sp. FlaQc-30 TaxID=3374179 RepID=UPI003757DD93
MKNIIGIPNPNIIMIGKNNMNAKPIYSLSQIVTYFLKLGTIGFGGPVALVEYMHRDLVEKRGWISEDDYKEGMALAQLAPGPLAAQLGIYLGYVHYRLVGATLAGLAFVLPSFLIVCLLGLLYVQSGGLPWMQAIFFGVGSAVIGIITMSSYKLVKKTVKKDWLMWGIVTLSGIVTFMYEEENLCLIMASGIIVWLRKKPPKLFIATQKAFFVPLFLQTASPPEIDNKLTTIGMFFLKAGAFVFGSGLAIVPFLYGGVVKEYHWLNDHQFMDAVAVAMVSPGPVVITVGFIGYLTAGFQGASVAALATFLPCYLFTVLPAPYFKKYGQHPGIKAFIDGVTAAAIGAIAGAAVVLGKRQITDIFSIAIAFITILLLIRFKKLPEPIIILAAALLGLIFKSSF